MPEPAVGSVVLVCFEDSIDGFAVAQIAVKLSANQVVEGTHIARVSCFIVVVIKLMKFPKLRYERLHHANIATYNAAVQKRFLFVLRFILGIVCYVISEVSGVVYHPRIIQCFGFVAAEKCVGVLHKEWFSKGVSYHNYVRDISNEQIFNVLRVFFYKIIV